MITGKISRHLSSIRKRISTSNLATSFRRTQRVKLVLCSSHRFKRHQSLPNNKCQLSMRKFRCLSCPFRHPHRRSIKKRSLSPQTLSYPISPKRGPFPMSQTSPTSSRRTPRLFTMSSHRVRRKVILRSSRISRSNWTCFPNSSNNSNSASNSVIPKWKRLKTK